MYLKVSAKPSTLFSLLQQIVTSMHGQVYDDQLSLPLLVLAPFVFSTKTYGGYLYPQDRSCHSIISSAVAQEARMDASLLRLHFHDCFVKASILLDSTGSIISEKGSNPNMNLVCGFDVIDELKSAFEQECPNTEVFVKNIWCQFEWLK